MITASIVSFHHSVSEMQKIITCILDSMVELLYIVDNSSNDSLRILAKYSDRIRYIHSINLGYGAGHNIAIREAIQQGSQYHIVVNPDIYFEKDTIEKLATYMDIHSQVGLVMPKVLYPDGSIQFLCKLLPTPIDLLGRRFFPLGSYMKKRNQKYELRFTKYDEEMLVPSLSGCFMFLRIDILKKTGLFDQRYFMYAEDLDLCRRIGEISHTIYYPEVCVYHEYEKGSYKQKKLLGYHLVSVFKYFNKWGWFIDGYRKRINQKTLKMLGY